MTPYYNDDTVTLYHGDAANWADFQSHVLITDPPYGFGAYETDVAPIAGLLGDMARVHITAAIFGYPEHLVAWCVANSLHPSEWVTWWPTNAMRGRDGLLQRESEHVAIFGEVPGAARVLVERSESAKRIAQKMAPFGRARPGDQRRAGDVWRDPKPGSAFTAHLKRHPNEKPMSLMLRLVELCSEPGDVIFDPFAGSGTTLEAAKLLGRRAIGIEIVERYCEIAAQRCAQEVLAVA